MHARVSGNNVVAYSNKVSVLKQFSSSYIKYPEDGIPVHLASSGLTAALGLGEYSEVNRHSPCSRGASRLARETVPNQ